MKRLDWVADARVRVREEGHVLYGDVLVVPATERNLLNNIDAAREKLLQLDWRLYDLTISPVRRLEWAEEEEATRAGGP